MEDKVNDFIDAYNTAITFYETATTFNEDLDIKGALVGDGTTRRVIDNIGTMMTQRYEGVSGSSAVLQAFSEIGISTERNGKLTLDSEVFQDALDDDYSKVVDLFTGQREVSETFASDTAAAGISGTLTILSDGVGIDFTVGAGDSLDDIADDINNTTGLSAKIIEDGGAFRLSITSSSGSLEDLTLDTDALSGVTFTKNAGVLGAVHDQIANVYVDEENGILTTKNESIDSQIEDLQESMDRLDVRLENYEARLRKRFTAMEIAMAKIQQSSAGLSAILSQGGGGGILG